MHQALKALKTIENLMIWRKNADRQ